MAGVKGFFKRLLGIEHLHSRIDRAEAELSSQVEYETRRVLTQVREEDVKGLNWRIDQISKELTVRMDAVGLSTQEAVRAEYGTLPRFLFHQPLDYLPITYPPDFSPLDSLPDEPFPIPGPYDRTGDYPNDPTAYLRNGKQDHDFLLGLFDQHGMPRQGAKVLDFGCSSGRVLRHFESEYRERDWRLLGVDTRARSIEWVRRHLPKHIEVSVCSAYPHLPFEDNSLDAVYSCGAFIHIKFLWDMWLQELRRVLKPSGLLLASIYAEPAWSHFYQTRQDEVVKTSLPTDLLDSPMMTVDYLFHGNQSESQVFWKADIAREFWGRYLTVIDILPPDPKVSFQSWMICRK